MYTMHCWSRPAHLPAQVGCETATKTGMVMVFGEITTQAKVDYEAIVRKTCRDIGFTSAEVGLDADKCKVQAFSAMRLTDVKLALQQCRQAASPLQAVTQECVFQLGCQVMPAVRHSEWGASNSRTRSCTSP